MTSLRNWFRKLSSKRHKPPGRPKGLERVRLTVEGLEERTVPTIMFIPQQHLETVAANNGETLSSYGVELVYWGPGSYWTQYKRDQYTAAAGKLLSSGYFDGVTQYGSDGRVYLFSSTVLDDTSKNPLPGTLDQDEVEDQMDLLNQQGNSLQTGQPTIYVFATPDYWSHNFGPNDVGYNWFGNGVPIVWNGYTDSVDHFTSMLGHELVESLSSPDGNGIEVYPGNGDTSVKGQIADWEPNLYQFRTANGVEVQPYWSQKDQVFIIGDGVSFQQFWITPVYNNGTYTGMYDVTVLGDQPGLGVNDVYDITTASVNGKTDLSISANFETVLFDLGTVRNIFIGAGTGDNILSIEGLPFGTIGVGSSGNLKVIYNGGGQMGGEITASVQGKLTVVDASPASPQNVTIGATSVNLDGQLNLWYTLGSTGSLEVDSAPGTNYTILATPFGGAPLTVRTAGGNNHISLQGASSQTFLDTSGNDTVTVGNNGYLNNINALVYVLGFGGTQLTVDDSSDIGYGTYTIGNLDVLYGSARIYYIDMQSVSVLGGKNIAGTDQFVVQSTESGTPVNITTGAGTGTNEVDVAGDSSLLTIIDEGTDTVKIGTTQSLSPITAVQVDGDNSTVLTVNDQNNPGSPPSPGNIFNYGTQYTINKYGLTRYAYPLYEFGSGPLTTIKYSHLEYLVLYAGNNGPNAVAVEGTSCPTVVHAGTSTTRLDVTPTSKDLDNIVGILSIQDGNPVLNVYDQNDPFSNPSAPTTYDVGFGVTRTSYLRFGGPLVVQISCAGFSALNVYTSSSPNQVTASADTSPVTINSGAADAVTVTGFGPLTVNAHGGTLTLDDGVPNYGTGSGISYSYNDGFIVTDQEVVRNQHVQVTTSGTGGIVHQRGGGGGTTTNYYFTATVNYQNVTALTINGAPVPSTFNVWSTPAGVPVKVNGAAGATNQFGVGVSGSVKNIRSQLTINGGGPKDTLLIDDSQSTSQDKVTITPTQVGSAATDQFFGAGGSLTYGNTPTLTLKLSHAADDTVALTPSAVTAFFLDGDPSEYAAGHGALLDIDLTGVVNELLTATGPGAGVVSFGNRQSITFGNLKSVQTH
jgi:hypothetical protein